MFFPGSLDIYNTKRRPIMIWGGAEEIEKKNLGGPSPEKKISRGFSRKKEFSKGIPAEKNKSIFDFSSSPPPQIINGRPLTGFFGVGRQEKCQVFWTFVGCVI